MGHNFLSQIFLNDRRPGIEFGKCKEVKVTTSLIDPLVCKWNPAIEIGK